ncbi:cellulose biosynthesis protein BcsQ [Natranaerovirga hydrolytica]|uniref:Cellulose biosynthesis protein BcsQ n=1 Tax=Natranaerovirga hydrolytica TaxID=680378 RepID=A0A4R1MJY1_9FIRM|nr:AAA family ATPase [Natranaerovirga hydrolytica]TCK90639.1 cellulose biosynthesis protein BcsQ [Natranaerovirga hydrolytica]
MNVLLVSGNLQVSILSYIGKKVHCLNANPLMISELYNHLEGVSDELKLDAIIISNEGFIDNINEDIGQVSKALQWIEKNKTDTRIIVITSDALIEKELKKISTTYDNLKVYRCYFKRIPFEFYGKIIEDKQWIIQKDHSKEIKKEKKQKEEKSSFLERFRSKSKDKSELKATDELSKQYDAISRGISKIIAVTGHRGAGLTSTAINLATEANKRGLSSFIIDMDIDYRSTNMYYSTFHNQTQKEEEMNASLIRVLARPQDYSIMAHNIKDNLWLTSLGYDFQDEKLIQQFYNSNKLIGLLSVLKNKFNLVILDMPMDLFKYFEETLMYIDVFGLCINNNLYSILSTLRNLDVVLEPKNISYINAKSKVIVTKYNDQSRFKNEIFVPNQVCEILTSGLNESFLYDVKLAGYIPYSSGFDSQIETDIPIVNTNKEYEKAYGNALLRLMEG